jgi:PAS domain S-box-containing protein
VDEPFTLRAMKFISTKTYIVLGLVSMVSSALLAASFLGLVPDRAAAQREGRLTLAEAIAAGSTAVLSSDDPRKLDAVLRFVMSRNEDVRSIGVRTTEGKLVLAVGDHARNWVAGEAAQVGDTQIKVPVWAGSQPWGQVEFRFKPITGQGFLGIFQTPLVQLVMFCGVACFLGFQVYLSRVLRNLDPSQAIPGRVRSALDSLTEGLLVIDQKRNIVLTNQALVSLLGKSHEELMGTPASTIAWMDEGGSVISGDAYPWVKALDEGVVQRDSVLRLAAADGRIRTFVVNSSPVLGTTGKPGGVLISLEDITQLEENKVELRSARDEAQAANQAKSR